MIDAIVKKIRRTITFSTICDGVVDLLPVRINGRNETDETNCEQWPCDNPYTRCDGYWNYPNGTDEINCDSSTLNHCSSHHHLCVSLVTNQLVCLPIEKVNDRIVDCLGGIDGKTLCSITVNYYYREKKFNCQGGKFP